jgi:hypothetical protein
MTFTLFGALVTAMPAATHERTGLGERLELTQYSLRQKSGQVLGQT